MKKCFIRPPQGPFVTKHDFYGRFLYGGFLYGVFLRGGPRAAAAVRGVEFRGGSGRAAAREQATGNEAAKPSERRKANNRQTRMERGHNETGTTRETS